MGKCGFCGEKDDLISETLKICRSCILNKEWDSVKDHISRIHTSIRKKERLPPIPPNPTESKITYECDLCINSCKLSSEDLSYCGLRSIKKSEKKILPMPTDSIGYMHGYLDANPTNCCNAWFCPAGTSKGYPTFSCYEGPEYGTYSYAVFLYGCTFDCLFCQNSSHKIISPVRQVKAEDVVDDIFNNQKITCVCFFGGTPEPQLPFTINLSKQLFGRVKKESPKRKLRICWEWNGSGRRDLVEKCLNIAIKSGGNIKFDLKFFHEKLNYALCGVSNRRTLENLKFLVKKYFGTREGVPEISGCTLLVPGYTNHEEVEKIAQFLSSIDPEIPYSLLVFHPDYMMKDLPVTPKKHVNRCLKVARSYLENVHLGNSFLL